MSEPGSATDTDTGDEPSQQQTAPDGTRTGAQTAVAEHPAPKAPAPGTPQPENLGG